MNCLVLNLASSMNRDACNKEDKPENDSIELKRITIIFLFVFNKDNCMEGMENSIRPLKRNECVPFIKFSIILQGIENNVITPKILSKVLKE